MPKQTASIAARTEQGNRLILELSGRLDADSLGEVWQQAEHLLARAQPRELLIDASGVQYADGSGMAFLVDLRCRQQERAASFEITGLPEKLQKLLELYAPPDFEKPAVKEPKPPNLAEEMGRMAYAVWSDWRRSISFLGELAAALTFLALHPRQIRWKEVFLVSEKAGVNALPIIALIAFLVGLIMAFQAAIPMGQFGVEIYVADLTALSILRELGPLMTSLTLAGRSGSSFAAEIGTMKVNEEIDALLTMG